ncbi:MAG: DUF4465 domain-containing protein [Bacteroidetes bacterium]|jgi:hypothetical protein|nr:DUF4465 domain-containing protein [Bacteroidota bacterium]
MRKLYFFCFFTLVIFSWLPVKAQVENLNFEEELLLPDTFINGQDGTEGISIDPIDFPIVYDFENDFWSGQWAVSTVTDSVTPNFTNLYGPRPGGGADGSSVFLVGQAPFGADNLQFTSSVPVTLQSVDITNTTYAYYVIRDGNQFSKAFGGPSGDDPDYFYIRWKGFLQGEVTDSLDIYLADYRFSDNSQDYILSDWTSFNLEELGVVDRVEIEFFSSDVGQFGINTPVFFNLDNLSFMRSSSISEQTLASSFSVYPNPVKNTIRWSNNENVQDVALYTLDGALISNWAPNRNQLNLGDLPAGTYLFVAKTSAGDIRRMIVKQ